MKKRIVIEVGERFHSDIKRLAKERHLTVKAFVISLLILYIKEKYERVVIYDNVVD